MPTLGIHTKPTSHTHTQQRENGIDFLLRRTRKFFSYSSIHHLRLVIMTSPRDTKTLFWNHDSAKAKSDSGITRLFAKPDSREK